ncbi:glyoxalase [Polaribacter sp. WD7]|uniref:glyoxalase n=1 Tax=Polaribacter sp. WD7 TaxID=2269061 RepID=UPI000DF48276|nr:glyoxalase [Polaribacter sp. WD7]RCS27380.1 glyoxalase [Polaribacter sp. WD7]
MNKKERPVIQSIVNKSTTVTEKFQNEVIRPVIKMQHKLLIVLFEDYLFEKKIEFALVSKDKKSQKIQSILKTDLKFRTLILGCIVGCFSVEELKIYNANRSEFSKRINQIIIQRLQDTYSIN